MKHIRALAILAAVLAVASTNDDARAQQWGMMQGQWGEPGSGYMMGPWMMGPNGMMGQGSPGMMGWQGQGAEMCTMMTAHIEGRLAFLRAELKITEAQAPLWETYATSARVNSQTVAERCTAMMGQHEGTPPGLLARLDLHEQMMAAQLESMRAVHAALKPLYDALDETQRQMADRLLWGPMGMM